MIVLAIDTSHPVGSAALARDGSVLGWSPFGTAATHLQELGGVVNTLLTDGDLDIKQVDRLALVSGPGSFTGLRIGMAFVKGIHAALGTGVVVMNSLELLSHPLVDHHAQVAAMIDARKAEVYAAVYRKADGKEPHRLEIVREAHVATAGAFVSSIELEDTVFAGSGALHYREHIETTLGGRGAWCAPEENLPSTRILSTLAESMTELLPSEVASLEPFYIRSSDAALKRLREVKADG